MNTLLIMLEPSANTQVWHWAYGDFAGDGSYEYGSAQDSDQKTETATRSIDKIWAILPGASVITRVNDLASLSAKQQKQAIGFNVEDDLAASLSDTHIALSGERARIAITAKTAVQAALDELAAHGLSPDYIAADYELLPSPSTLHIHGRITSRRDDGTGFAVEPGLAAHIGLSPAKIPAEASIETFWEQAAQTIQGGAPVLNLRQDEFAKIDSAGRGQWLRLSGLAAAVFIAFAGLQIALGLKFKGEAQRTNAEIAAIYKMQFPGKALPANPALALLKAGQGGPQADTDFLRLSAVLSESIKQVDGVKISAVRFDRARGQLNVSLLYTEFADAEKLRAAVTSAGAVFEEAGTRQGTDGVTGDIVLRGAS